MIASPEGDGVPPGMAKQVLASVLQERLTRG